MQSTDNTSQLLRLYYLQQLGISSWLPRVPLPGALETDDTFVAELPAEAPVETAIPLAVTKPALVIEDEAVVNKPVLAREVAVEESKPVQKPAVTTETKPALIDDQALSPFQILLVVISSELAVAVQIPSAMKPVLRDADTRLLVNILRWLGLAWPAQAITLQFHWPLPGVPATGVAEAGKGLQIFLDQAAQEREFKRLVVFGAAPTAALRASGKQQNAWQAWYTHSLAELLAVPALKHETWQTLIPLKAQLSS